MLRVLSAVLIAGLSAAAAHAQSPSLRMVGTDGEAVVEGVVLDGAAAFPVGALARLGATITDEVVETRVILYGDTLVFAAGSPFFRAGSNVHALALPARRSGGALHLPEQFFLEWLPQQHGERIAWRSGALRATSPLVTPGAVRPSVPVTRVVVIDPGHGGRDAGKIGPNGVREKDVVLEIGRRLRELLNERGYEVHMTRDRDTLIALGDRPHMANEWKNGRQRAVFLSIHANSWRPSVKGFETYFLSDARTEDARRVAEMENAAEQYDENGSNGDDAAGMILNSLRNDFYVRASNDLAEVVQRSIAEFHGGPDRGVKQAGFRVLVGALMPAVLIETAYLSNPEEARLLARSDFQQKLAWGIAEAVDRFFAQHEHLWTEGAP
ncbi:MAG TPA: N-acetylmuramoyl-L-alanine amidase [Longimicrobiales bacterium]|nr:N-acetylmuramoyl-L-alanine amidase [Longimicrobiales bacterium]